MAKKDTLSLSDLIASQEKNNLKMSAAIEEQLRSKLTAENKLADEIDKALVKEDGNGLNSNVSKLLDELRVTNNMLRAFVKGKDKQDLTEADVENANVQKQQLDLLTKIAENTNPSASNVEPPAPNPPSGGGFFSKIGDSLKGLGGSMSGLAKNLLASAAALWILSKALDNFKKVEWESVAKATLSLLGLAAAAKIAGSGDAHKSILAISAGTLALAFAFERFNKVEWADIGKGVLALTALGLAVKVAGSGDSWKTVLGFSAGIIALAYGLQEFADVDWESMGKAALTIAGLTIAVKVLEGSKTGIAVMLGMAAAVFVIAKAMTTFAELDWTSIGKGLITIGALAGMAALIGFATVPILGASAALAALGAAIIVLGEGLSQVGQGIADFIGGLQQLSNIDGVNLLSVAAGITAISGALLLFGGAGMATALANLVTNFLSLGSDSPVEQLQKIGKAGAGIEKAATGMERLASALKSFAGINVDNLDKAVQSAEKLAASGIKIVAVSSQLPVANTPPNTANKVYAASVDAVSAANQPAKAVNTNVVNAPTTITKQTKQIAIRQQVRNNESSIVNFYKSRFAG